MTATRRWCAVLGTSGCERGFLCCFPAQDDGEELDSEHGIEAVRVMDEQEGQGLKLHLDLDMEEEVKWYEPIRASVLLVSQVLSLTLEPTQQSRSRTSKHSRPSCAPPTRPRCSPKPRARRPRWPSICQTTTAHRPQASLPCTRRRTRRPRRSRFVRRSTTTRACFYHRNRYRNLY